MANGTVRGNSDIGTLRGAGGGGVMNYERSTITLTNCNLTGNSASGNVNSIFTGGGAVQNTFGCTITLTNCTVTGNSSNSSAGGQMTPYGNTAPLPHSTGPGKPSTTPARGGAPLHEH